MAWGGYEGALGAYPLAVKCATSMLGFGIADVVAQTLAKDGKEFDAQRTARLAAFGLVLYGPASSWWCGL